MMIQERVLVVQNPRFFPFFGKEGDLVVKSFLCLAKSLLCVHVQFACAQIFQERPQIFRLCFSIIFQGVFFPLKTAAYWKLHLE